MLGQIVADKLFGTKGMFDRVFAAVYLREEDAKSERKWKIRVHSPVGWIIEKNSCCGPDRSIIIRNIFSPRMPTAA